MRVKRESVGFVLLAHVGESLLLQLVSEWMMKLMQLLLRLMVRQCFSTELKMDKPMQKRVQGQGDACLNKEGEREKERKEREREREENKKRV